ncbi:hypothetical protein B0T17DRAFT_656970 [Bombardia bombarda]|uniref:Uncharacterized protein n=1 Tax=Bombardia bombarda TaxID=252184 RepID=A0AA39WI95_9PEZI|nr:hypothetical protein B0T17DRAFT_656970 [Bombardia bombarda]
MGRLGPLTSQALGRSPYDDVVQGEGVADPNEPLQLYDDRGRPVNPETRRINRDVIRSHNEVMLVIGVAEPETSTIDVQTDSAQKHQDYEDEIGEKLFYVGEVLETAGAWGVNGLRQRILLYKQYARIPFHQLFLLQSSQQSWQSYLFAGLPSFLASNVVQQVSLGDPYDYLLSTYCARVYIRLHLDLFTFLQRTGIISSSQLLPSWRFFVPGSSQSPIPIPRLPTSFTWTGSTKWLAALALGATPFAAFYLYRKFSNRVTEYLQLKIYQNIPRPFNPNSYHRLAAKKSAPPPPPPVTTTTPTEPPAGQEVPAEAEQQPRTGRELIRTSEPAATSSASPAPGSEAEDPLPDPAAAPLPTTTTTTTTTTTPRRHSHGHPGQDEFASDDEDMEIVSATLISFDVEASDSADVAPGGVWSAELRPNVSDAASRAMLNQPPLYRDTMLTRLPAVIAADLLAARLAQTLTAPFESLALLGVARSYIMQRVGGGVLVGIEALHGGMGGGLLEAFSWGRMANVLGVELLVLFLQSDWWGALTLVGESFGVSEEEWGEREEEMAMGEGG